jgi:hypothetical protein
MREKEKEREREREREKKRKRKRKRKKDCKVLGMTFVDVFQDVFVSEDWRVIQVEENTMSISSELCALLSLSVMHWDLLKVHCLKL